MTDYKAELHSSSTQQLLSDAQHLIDVAQERNLSVVSMFGHPWGPDREFDPRSAALLDELHDRGFALTEVTVFLNQAPHENREVDGDVRPGEPLQGAITLVAGVLGEGPISKIQVSPGADHPC